MYNMYPKHIDLNNWKQNSPVPINFVMKLLVLVGTPRKKGKYTYFFKEIY